MSFLNYLNSTDDWTDLDQFFNIEQSSTIMQQPSTVPGANNVKAVAPTEESVPPGTSTSDTASQGASLEAGPQASIIQQQPSTAGASVQRHNIPMTFEAIKDKINKQMPEKSKDNAKWARGTFNKWLRDRNEHILNSGSSALMFLSTEGHAELSTLSKDSLNSALTFFVFEVRKTDGTKYPSSSLRHLICSINYWVKHMDNKPWHILSDPEFSGCQKALDAAMKEAAKEGFNLKTKRGACITQNQEESLWNRGYLGQDNPKKLTRTMLYLLSINCALRGGKELRQLTVGDNSELHLVKRSDGQEVLVYTEQQSKTNNHGLKHHHHESKTVTVYPADNPERCPVQIYKQMISLRPLNCKTDALFLQPNPHFSSSKWFNPSPMGHNTLAMSFRSLMEAAGEDGNYTNQSGRRTSVTRIMEATGDKRLAMSISGHRSDCMDVYNEVSQKRLKLASNIIQNNNMEVASSTTVQISNSSSNNNVSMSEMCTALNITPKKVTFKQADGSSVIMEF